jgi:hypothetical protein
VLIDVLIDELIDEIIDEIIDELIDEIIDQIMDCSHVAVQLLFSIPGITIARPRRRNRIFLQKTIVPAIRPGIKTRFVEFSAPVLNTIYCCTTTPLICLET